MIRAILYDLDGVLVDACDWHYESLNRALREIADFSIPREAHLLDFNGLPTKTKLAKLLDHRVIKPDQVKAIFNAKQKYTVEVINELAQPYAEKIELHEYITSQRILSACVTNSIRETATIMLDKTWQLRYMRMIVSNEDVVKGKPNPDPYWFAMKRLCVTPDETLIIEDSDVGFASATASGAHVHRVAECCHVDKQSVSEWLREL